MMLTTKEFIENEKAAQVQAAPQPLQQAIDRPRTYLRDAGLRILDKIANGEDFTIPPVLWRGMMDKLKEGM